MNPRITQVKYGGNHKLILTFDNDEVKEFDLSTYLQYPVFGPLKDESFCSKARICNGTVAWDDIIDFDPDTLYLESSVSATY